MKYIVAIDSFKGCLTSEEAGTAAAGALRGLHPEADVVTLTVSDGGDGMLDAFLHATGGKRITVAAHDAMMRPVMAQYGIKDDTAIIEVAQACGLTLIEPDKRDAMKATSFGVGEIIADAMSRGCKKLLIGLGGTATTDGGTGMLHALIERLAPHGNFDDIRSLTSGLSVTLATDVTNPLYGPEGAAAVFAPQKGASPAMVSQLDKRLRLFASMSAKHFGFDRSQQPGAGAAGGLGYAFLQYFNAGCKPGADLLFDMLHIDDLLHGADLVITGEGSADRQTLMGKLPFKVMERARRQGVPTLLIAGKLSDRDALVKAGFADAVCINKAGVSLAEAMKPDTAKRNIVETLQHLLS